MSDSDDTVIIILILMFAIGLMGLGAAIQSSTQGDIGISEETAKEICKDLNGDHEFNPKDYWDYDHEERDEAPIQKGQLACEKVQVDNEYSGKNYKIVGGNR